MIKKHLENIRKALSRSPDAYQARFRARFFVATPRRPKKSYMNIRTSSAQKIFSLKLPIIPEFRTIPKYKNLSEISQANIKRRWLRRKMSIIQILKMPKRKMCFWQYRLTPN